MSFARLNIAMRLIKRHDSLRSKLKKKHYQPSIITQISGKCFLEIDHTSFIRKIKYSKVTYNPTR